MATDDSESAQMLFRNKQVPGGVDLSRLLRYSHIFSSVLRKNLEDELLRRASPLPISMSQFHIMKLMSFDGCNSVGDAAACLGVSPPAASKSIEKLVKLGLVVRETSAGDRRARHLSVSEEGRRVIQEFEALKTERLTMALENFQPEEIEQMSDLLERFSLAVLSQATIGEWGCLRCAAYVDSTCSVGRLRGSCPCQKVREPSPQE